MQVIWLALGYNVPANPSKNRVYVWRKLKEMGAGYFRPGVAILPRSPQSMSQFRSLAQRIRDMGGEASIAELRFIDQSDEQGAIRQFREQIRLEYVELMRDCVSLVESIRGNLLADQGADSVKKFMRRYGKIRSRDFFMSGPGSDMSGILDELAGDIAHSAGELSRQLRTLLD